MLHLVSHRTYKLVEGLVVCFLFFVFIVLIVKQFQPAFHFPLLYFVNISITAIVRVRMTIVDHKAPMEANETEQWVL